MGVGNGTRTHDNRNHNPGLYQLSYSHHQIYGPPDRIRTCDPRLRRPMLYPAELRAARRLSKRGRGEGIRTPRHPAPKAGALPGLRYAPPQVRISIMQEKKLETQ